MPMIDRRTLMTGAAALTVTGTFGPRESHAQQVPNSVGTQPPKLKAPANAADCHMHTYDPARFTMPPNPRAAPSDATAGDYRLFQKRISTTRVVSVQARNYRPDNQVTPDALAQLAPN